MIGAALMFIGHLAFLAFLVERHGLSVWAAVTLAMIVVFSVRVRSVEGWKP